jgi:hypothetical protein
VVELEVARLVVDRVAGLGGADVVVVGLERLDLVLLRDELGDFEDVEAAVGADR